MTIFQIQIKNCTRLMITSFKGLNACIVTLQFTIGAKTMDNQTVKIKLKKRNIYIYIYIYIPFFSFLSLFHVIFFMLPNSCCL